MKKVTLIVGAITIATVGAINVGIKNENNALFRLGAIESIAAGETGDVACSVTNKKGEVLFSCYSKDNAKCSITKMGYTLSCNEAEEKD